MDVSDQLQSGLFFHQLNTIDSRLNIHQPKSLPSTDYHDSANFDHVPPPNIHTPGPTHTPPIPLPLLSVSVDVDVHGRLCSTKVTQQFSNTSPSIAENATYVFPVYDGSVITSFRCWVGNDKLLEGAVKAKEAARADFQHAVSQHKVAVLVEELAPEVFETNVGNIPGQTTVKIEITYTNLLKVDNSTGGVVLTVPTSIAPRYGGAPEKYSANQSLLTDGLRVNVQASMPAVIRKMESRTHPISVEIGAVAHHSFSNFAAGASSEAFDLSKGRATLAGISAILDRDFVLYILSGSGESPKSQALAVTQRDQPLLSTVAVTIHPGDLFLQNVNSEGFETEIIFVADRSGSMSSKIHFLINVMNVSLRSLPQKCSFNIASFGSSFAWLWPASEKYGQENLDIALQHVGSFEANFGGTDICPALQSVLDRYNKRSDIPTSVILLTDGEVWDVDNVIQLVRDTVSNHESNIRFFSIGIGDRVSHRLVEGIGQQGCGYAEVVPESSMGSWQERVIQMLKAALTPSRLQCEVDFGQELTTRTCAREDSGYTVHYPAMIKAPHHIPVLNTFSYFSLYYMLESGLESLPTIVTVSATTDKGEKLTTQLPLRKLTDQTAIHHLAAKALMNDYETGKSWLHTLNSTLKSTDPAAFEKILEQQAQQVGQQWSITGKWTSYVAVDQTSTQHHEISVRKADTIEISQLIRPRYTPNTLFPQHTNSVTPESHASVTHVSCRKATWGSRTLSGKRKSNQAKKGDTSNSSDLDRAYKKRFSATRIFRHVFKQPTEKQSTKEPQPCMRAEEILSLDNILFTQAANGKFNLDDSMLSDALRRKCGTMVLEQFLDTMIENTLSVQRDPDFRFLHLNILAIIYITEQHAASKGLWELQVAKARQWVKQKMIELLKKGDLEELPEISLEELERSIVKELHEQDSQST